VPRGFRNWVLPLSLITIASICVFTIQFLTPRVTKVAIDDGARKLEDVPFPFLRQTSGTLREYHLTAQIDRRPYQFGRFALVPTLCLTSAEVDGQSLFNGPDPEHCDFVKGYDVRLPADRPLHLDAKVSTNFDIFGLSARASVDHPLVRILRLIAGASFAAGLYLAMRKWRFSRPVSLILLGTLPVQLLYLSHTSVIDRTYDVLGHLQHIEFIAYHHSLPSEDFCHECYQPGLYYLLAAPIYSLARSTGVFDPMTGLQYLSLAWFWIFLIMSARIMLLWLPRQREVLLAVALLAFWPGGFLHSARVSNDIPLYAFFATCLYFVLSWWKTGKRSHLVVASLLAACGLLIKATMLVPAGAIGILILYRIYWEREKKSPWRPYLLPVLLLVAGIGVYLAQNLWKAGASEWNWRSLYVGKEWQTFAPWMYVGNSWRHYLFLNLTTYFKSPFVDSVIPGTGREYFWNYVLKSSMFGDYHWFQKPVERVLALVMSPLLLGLVVLFGIGVARNLRDAPRRSLPLLVVIFLSFLVLFLHRFSMPYSANNDFRFIYPVVIPMTLLLAEGAGDFAIGRALSILFCGLSAAFYLSV
jgi:hypothetical protein